MKKANSSTYLPITSQVFWSIPIEYTRKKEETILSVFPKNKQKAALKEIKECISKLVSWVRPASINSATGTSYPKITPINIKRSEYRKQLLLLRKYLEKLNKQLTSLSQNQRYLRNELSGEFCKIYRISLGDFEEMVLSFIVLIHSKMSQMKSNVVSGKKEEPFHDAVKNLINIWKKYTGRKPTLRNVKYAVNQNLDSQKLSGPFLKYITESIRSVIPYPNEYIESVFSYLKPRNKAALKKMIAKQRSTIKSFLRKPSLANIASNILYPRNLMVKISSK